MSGLSDNPIIKAFAESVSPVEYVRLLSVTNNLTFVLGALDNMAKLQSADAKQRAQIAEQLDTAFSALSGTGEFTKGLVDRLGNDGIEVVLNANVFSADGVSTVRKAAGSSPVIDLFDQRLTSFDDAVAALRKEMDGHLLGKSHPVSASAHVLKCGIGVGAAVQGVIVASAGGIVSTFLGGAAFGAGVVLMAEHCFV
jgi:hypothetical protein